MAKVLRQEYIWHEGATLGKPARALTDTEVTEARERGQIVDIPPDVAL